MNQLCVYMKDQASSAINDSTKRVQEILVKFLEKNYGSTTVYIFDNPKEIVVCLYKSAPHVIRLYFEFSCFNPSFNLIVRQSSKLSGKMK